MSEWVGWTSVLSVWIKARCGYVRLSDQGIWGEGECSNRGREQRSICTNNGGKN